MTFETNHVRGAENSPHNAVLKMLIASVFLAVNALILVAYLH
ncbi:hypothetical protein [Roseibium denhamense]|uniref:YnhF family membrane protein n=1 Tax=Roseibium denhamense TaxID=76305 RepID=A0ABY1N825_9HYPH|nr:hypothetical protein [Roseibium denhamense]SMP02522.1 hypothetical protein SAMN06265374_0455 [Roseibium denhamense]